MQTLSFDKLSYSVIKFCCFVPHHKRHPSYEGIDFSMNSHTFVSLEIK